LLGQRRGIQVISHLGSDSNQEPSRGDRGTESVHGRGRGVLLDRSQDFAQLAAAVVPDPKPELLGLARTAKCAPSADRQGVVQDQDGVRCLEPSLEDVERAEIAVHDPGWFCSEPDLGGPPGRGPERQQSRLPEVLVELKHGQPRE
jgi:hypothetical protein